MGKSRVWFFNEILLLFLKIEKVLFLSIPVWLLLTVYAEN